jgi:hypothetical protein
MNYLIILFIGVLVVSIGLFILFGFSGTPLEKTDAPTTGPLETTSELIDIPRYMNTQPIPIKPFFRSMKTVYSARAFRFNGTNITLGEESDMNKWRVQFPLNFTHARLERKIFKFYQPNTSNSQGSIVDEWDEPINPQPPSFFGNTIEFGMFY